MPEDILVGDNDVFISYRRQGGGVLARLLYESLRYRKYSVFYDYESLSSGEYLPMLLAAVRQAKDVLVVWSLDSLERCIENEDVMYKEIKEAVDNKKNIILVLPENFKTPKEEELAQYPKERRDVLEKLFRHNGYAFNLEHYENTLRKICDGFVSKPISYTEDSAHQAAAYLLKNGMDALAEDEKSGLVDSVLSASYGTKIASAVSAFLRTNPRYYNNIRLKFNYEISIDTAFSFGSIPIDSDKYFKLSEVLSYQKHYINSAPGREFWISFARDLDELDVSLRNENDIFSENLLMDEEDLQAIIDLSEEEQKQFYLKRMHTQFNLNGKVLTPVELIINKAGIFAKYELEQEFSDECTMLDVKIKFHLPHRKVSSYFFASISDPTYSPSISFSYPEDEVSAEMISFMNRNITTSDTRIFDGERTVSLTDEWVLPMSGVVFIMTPVE